MADQTEIGIKFNVDVEEAKNRIEELRKTQEKLRAEMESMDSSSEEYAKLDSALKSTTKEISSLEKNVSKSSVSINEFDDVTRAAEITVNNLGLANTKLGKIVSTVAGTVGRLKTATDAYRKAQNAANITIKEGEKATKAFNAASKGNIILALVSLAIPAIIALLDKIKSTNKELETTEDVLERISSKYERTRNILSTIGSTEYIDLSIQIDELNEKNEVLKARMNNELATAGKITDEWKKMNDQVQEYSNTIEDNKRKQEIILKEIEAQNTLLKNQSELDKEISKNTGNITKLQQRLELEREKNGYSEKYFTILKNISDLEDANLKTQEEKLDNEIKALDATFDRYKTNVNSLKSLSQEEKTKLISEKQTSIELQKQTIEIQKQEIGVQRVVNKLKREQEQIQKIKQLQSGLQTASQLMTEDYVSGSERFISSKASTVSSVRELRYLYTNENKILEALNEQLDIDMQFLNDQLKTSFDNIDDFYRDYYKLQENAAEVLKKPANTLTSLDKEIISRLDSYNTFYSEFLSKMQQYSTHIDANVNATLQAEESLRNSAISLAEKGLLTDGDIKTIENSFNREMKFYDNLLQALRTGLDEQTEKYLEGTNGGIDAYNFYSNLGLEGISVVEKLQQDLMNVQKEYQSTYRDLLLQEKEETLEVVSKELDLGLVKLVDYRNAQNDVAKQISENRKAELENEVLVLNAINEKRRKAGEEEIDIARYVETEKEKIRNKENLALMTNNREMFVSMLGQAQNYTNAFTTIMEAATNDSKEQQRRNLIISTIANAGMAFGSTFASAKGGLGAKLAQAAAAAAAVTAQGVAQIAALKSETLNTNTGASSEHTSSRSESVSNTIISRNIPNTTVQPKTEVVLVVDDVTAKQMEQENVRKVSAI